MRIFLMIWILFTSVYVAEAQLLEDTDRKLKSARIERKGFSLFGDKKKVKKSGGIPPSKRQSAARYSSASSPFRSGRTVSPRYSTPGQKAQRYAGVTAPRYSVGNPFRGSRYTVVSRNSAGNPFRGRRYNVVSLNSPGNPFRGARYRVTPRYSAGGSPFANYRVTPRYSQGHPFRGRSNVSPRYSRASPFRNQRYNVTPRYSVGNHFKGYRFNVNPRYSTGMPFTARDYNISLKYSVTSSDFRKSRFAYHHTPIRYSEGMPFRGQEYKISPRYTGTKSGFFKTLHNREMSIAKYYQETSLWEGDAKSARLQFLMRQWDKLWSRLNGNLPGTRGVKDPGGKAKFDKKERVIWNN